VQIAVPSRHVEKVFRSYVLEARRCLSRSSLCFLR
jgi:hypothetical protein